LLYAHWYAVFKTTRRQIATFAFQYGNAGMVKCVFCTCCGLHCSKSPTRRTSQEYPVWTFS